MSVRDTAEDTADRQPSGPAAPRGADGAADETADDGQPVAVRETRRALTRPERRWLLAICLVAAAARLGWWLYAHVEPPSSEVLGGDPWMYWLLGNDIAHGRWYTNHVTGEPSAYYPVGFPAVLGGLYWVGNHVPFVDVDNMALTGMFQIVISTATVALTFVVGRRLAGPRAGLIAAAVLAVFPNLVFQVTTIQVETTFIFFTMAALAIIVDHDWSTGTPSVRRLVAFGAVLAACGLVRPFSLPVVLGVFLAVLATGWGWRRAVAVTAVPIAVIVLAFVPWTVRNWVVMDAFVPSSTNMGDTLCLDRNDEATGQFRWATHDGCADPDLPEAERNPASTRKALAWVVDNPGRELLQIVRRAHFMYRTDDDGIGATEGLGSGEILSDTTRDALTKTADLYFLGVLALAFAGLPFLRRAPRPERRIVVVLGAVLVVIPLLLWGNPRFHQPVVPFMAVSVGLLGSALWGAMTRRRAGGERPTAAPDGDPRPDEPALAGSGVDDR
jgi:4-amino-4-deoxy-L-arabinose transferase-like glycosyltransferase